MAGYFDTAGVYNNPDSLFHKVLSYYTYGALGHGKTPGMVNTGIDTTAAPIPPVSLISLDQAGVDPFTELSQDKSAATTSSSWNPVTALKDISKDWWKGGEGAEGQKSDGQQIMDLRNGGLAQRAFGDLANGFSGNGWSF